MANWQVETMGKRYHLRYPVQDQILGMLRANAVEVEDIEPPAAPKQSKVLMTGAVEPGKAPKPKAAPSRTRPKPKAKKRKK